MPRLQSVNRGKAKAFWLSENILFAALLKAAGAQLHVGRVGNNSKIRHNS